MIKTKTLKATLTAMTICLSLIAPPIYSATLNIADSPLFITKAAPALTMIVLGSDHRLFYEAYNDSSDINGDGKLDLHYNPAIDYYGYFDSHKCYTYVNTSGNLNKRFEPSSAAPNKTCSGTWSGDWLNWATMTRMDLLRKVLYGGYRSIDNSTLTVLKRVNIVQDAHSWGKEYTSIANDGYDIRQYTPLSLPSAGKHHLFANTTLLKKTKKNDNQGKMVDEPLFRVLQNKTARIWEWVSKERPVAGQKLTDGSKVNPTDYIVAVQVCDPSKGLESDCQQYPAGDYKPIGLLHQFGENDAMRFGLISKSYEKNLSGGVLRKNIEGFSNEIIKNSGIFTSTVNGIIQAINKLSLTGFGNNNYSYDGGWVINRPAVESEFKNWGNPIGEMMYEALRYLAGKKVPTSSFTYAGGVDSGMGLPQPTWNDPYANAPVCSTPNLLVISDINTSFDSDSVPGSAFSSFSGDIPIGAAALGQTIWNQEKGSPSKHFIGHSGTDDNGTPSAKTVTSFGNIRGLAPEEPTKQGSYYPASVAYYGRTNDISNVPDRPKVHTFVVALNSPLAEIKIPVAGQLITLVPFGKTVGGCSIGGAPVDPAQGEFQPTNQIVDFYVDKLTTTEGTFRVNFEDVEQGADHDMDAIVEYHYQVTGNTVKITLTNLYAAGCLIQHLGYVISGTTEDGVYLELTDKDVAGQGNSNNDILYFLDTPTGQLPGQRDNSTKLSLTSASRTFTVGATSTATLLKSPLYYAAKWGSFTDKNNNNIPDLSKEWDKDLNGVPDNFFLVSNPLQLKTQLKAAFQNILARTASAASAAINSGSLNASTQLYQAKFNSGNWTGQLLSFKLDPLNGALLTTGSGPDGSQWDAGEIITGQIGRTMITYNPTEKRGVSFRWPTNPSSPTLTEIDASLIAILNTNPFTGLSDGLGQERLDYLRGDQNKEQKKGGTFRDRTVVLGDIIHSTPLFVGSPAGFYRNYWGTGAPENSVKYSDFRSQYAARTPVIYFGANDGALHGVDANTGKELLAYFPSAAFKYLNQLTSPDYSDSHKYFVDGEPNVVDVFIKSKNSWATVLVGGLRKGGQGIYALDVTSPKDFATKSPNDILLWEFTDKDDKDLGYTYSQPALVRQPDGNWVAIFGNGYNNTENDGVATTSSTGNAVLYIVNAADGTLIQKLDTGVGMTQDPTGQFRPNGLSTPAVVDTNGDNMARAIYAGDLFGHLWKFDWNTSTNQWTIATFGNNNPTPLFTATDANGINQPITSRPNVRKIPTGLQIFFGTGKYFEVEDKDISNATPQTFYSLIDKTGGNGVISRIKLVKQSILAEPVVTIGAGETETVRITTQYTLGPNNEGWYLDLVSPVSPSLEGERVVSNVILRNDRIIFTTLIPSNNVCSYGGSSWLMELDAHNGSRLKYTPFDLNKDNQFNAADFVLYQGSKVAVSGKRSKVGIITSPAIIDAGKVEYKYNPGSSGAIGITVENPGPTAFGRQSWHEIR